ncbi:MAG: glycosyltransferase [Bacilli bacterium]|nr:glycosyltransferase [Methanobrevibacter sp.]MBR0059832.1 glycosyltransferase [Methanobrevibacter sp.]MBR0440149.1 glycosyltransferase [Bacilli bacterium]
MLFSVTIPTYKSQYLKETIDSVLSQSYKDFELIIVNDASPDDIDSIVKQYDDSRIRYYVNSINCGAKDVVDNWNICLSYAEGDYIVCLGDDDKLKPNCLKNFEDLIRKYPDVDVFHSQTELIDERSQYLKTLGNRPEWESVFSLIYSFEDSGLGAYLYKVETLRKNEGFYKLPYGWSSDFITAFIAAEEHGIVNTFCTGFQYRENGLSISHDISCIEDKINANLKTKDWVISFVNKTNNSSDQNLIKLIPHTIEKKTTQKIDELIEFDIRKNFYRAIFWFLRRSKYDISFVRFFNCFLKSIKYRYNLFI